MTLIAQLIAELREADEESFYQAPATTKALLTRAAEALARQEELLAEAGKVVEPPRQSKATREARKRANEARDFPINTCGASRHVEMIADALATGKPYPMLTEEADHCAGSLYATVAALWRARTEIERLLEQLPTEKAARDAERERAAARLSDKLKGE